MAIAKFALTNGSQCDVYPVYRDPVHDFGILRFDPKAIKYMPVSALELRPELAKGMHMETNHPKVVD